MKRITLFFAIVVSILVITACGGSTPAATPASAIQPPATQPPSSSSSSGNSTQVTVTLGDNTIKSSQTTFQVGVPYTFVITNTGSHAHNFNISTPVSITGSLDAALSSALLAVSRDKLLSNGSVTVQFTFPDSAAGAQLEFSCLIPKHYEDGMRLAITVTK